jgi:hypothetical protein
LLKGYVHEVVICCGSEVIARHARSYEREDTIYDPLHYLALLERKSNALDQAAPLQAWQLPEEFAQLRRLLEARLGKRGKREYIQILRLLECFPQEIVTLAVREALRLQAISFDALKHLVLCRIEHKPAHLDLLHYPHLPVAQVAMTAVSDYLGLLSAETEGLVSGLAGLPGEAYASHPVEFMETGSEQSQISDGSPGSPGRREWN